MSAISKEEQLAAIRKIMTQKFYCDGQTYQYKEELKAHGWKWEEQDKGFFRWTYTGMDSDKAIKHFKGAKGIYIGVCK